MCFRLIFYINTIVEINTGGIQEGEKNEPGCTTPDMKLGKHQLVTMQ